MHNMRKFQTIIITVTLFTLTLSGCAQTKEKENEQLSNKVHQIVKSIANEDMYMSSAVGYAGTRPEQWNSFQKLKKNATESELIILTSHKNAAVRSYAFQALADRNSDKTFDVLLEHLKDTAELETLVGCIGSSEQVGDFFLGVVYSPFNRKGTYELSERQKQLIDSILIFDDNITLWSKSRLISEHEPEEKYYTRFREIYLKEKSSASLIALSKFKKESDKEFIIDWLTRKDTDEQYQGLRALRNFIDDDFFQYLTKIHEQEIKKPTGFNYPLIRMLYFVLVQYQTEQTRELLEMSLQTKGSTYTYHSQYLWLALEKYPNPTFDGLQDRIKLTEYELNNVSYWLEGDDG